VADVVVIEPSSGWQAVRLRELWAARELTYFLVWRDIKVRYKQTLLGASWAVLQPAVTTIVFTVVFGNWLGIGGGFGGPYALYAFAAMVPWAFFSSGLSQGSRSLQTGALLISRVYFPRMILPIASILSYLLDLAIAAGLLIVVMAFYGVYPTFELLALPLFVVLLLVTSLGVTFVLGAANAQYRDIGYITPFLVQLWFFATPIVYPISSVPEAVRSLYAVNPMVSVIEGFRWAFLDAPFPAGADMAVSAAVAVAFFLGGALYFRRLERTIVDVV
jgi:lipopolysaccharide transport system permease protein